MAEVEFNVDIKIGGAVQVPLTGYLKGAGAGSNVTASATIPATDIASSTTVGRAVLLAPNPSAITFFRVNADNSVTLRSAADFRGDLSLGTAALVADSGLVHIAGTESITGSKSFTNNVGIGTASPTDTIGFGRAVDIQSTTGGAVYVRDSDIGSTSYAFLGADASRGYVGTFGSGYALQIWAEGGSRAAVSASGVAVNGAISATTTMSCNGSFTAGDSFSDSHTVNGLLLSGDASSVGGSIIIAGQYSGTQTTANFGGMASSGGAMLGYCVRPNNSSATGFLSTVSLTVPRSAIIVDGDGFGVWHIASSAASAGAAVTLTNKMQVGDLVASLSVEYLTLGVGQSTYGANLRHKDDGGTTRWLTGILGGAGARDWVLYDIANSRALITADDASTTVTVGGALVATKSLQVADVYAITAVTTAAQTRTLDLANGQVQTIAADQAFTLNVTGPAGVAISGALFYLYNNGGAAFSITVGTGWFHSFGGSLTNGQTHAMQIDWDGYRATRMSVINNSTTGGGDFRPT